ncbi:phosphodiester glycosidase family protein [Neobacillus sp. SM06]|uniref:phosphodiester glycosidase family protein n=1 Tax=Neobacillus sp. SM06 TaxID=3422492 RepID=UPI003D28E529
MDLITRDAEYMTRSKRKRKKNRLWRVFLILFLMFLTAGGGFLYGTDQGLQYRKLLVGSVLSTQHPQYVKYLRFLLSKSEFDALYDAWKNPKTVESKITDQKNNHIAKAAMKPSLSESIQVDTVNTANFTAKVMIIPDPTTVHVVTSKYSYKGEALSDLITENNAIAGINAGGFVDKGGTGSGGQMLGIVISNGSVLSGGDRNAPQLVGGFLKDGEFITGNYSVNQLLKLGVREAVSFGPQLIVNGVNRVSANLDGAWGWAPRTAIGQRQDGSVVMIITDGRFYWDKTHRGASMSDMAHLFEKYNAVNAIAMDGGGSTTMIKDGALLLKPATSTRVGMRYLPNAWVVIPH